MTKNFCGCPNSNFAFFSGRTFVRQQQNSITPYLDAGTVYGAHNSQLQKLLDSSSSKRYVINSHVG